MATISVYDSIVVSEDINNPLYKITIIDQLAHASAASAENSKLFQIDSTHFYLSYDNLVKVFSHDGDYDNITEIDSLEGVYPFFIDASHFYTFDFVWIGPPPPYWGGHYTVYGLDGSYNIIEVNDEMSEIFTEINEINTINIDSSHFATLCTAGVKIFSYDASYNISLVDTYTTSVAPASGELILLDSTHILATYYTAGTGITTETLLLSEAYALSNVDSLVTDCSSEFFDITEINSGLFVLAHEDTDQYVTSFTIDGSYNLTAAYSLLSEATGASTSGQVFRITEDSFFHYYMGTTNGRKALFYDIDSIGQIDFIEDTGYVTPVRENADIIQLSPSKYVSAFYSPVAVYSYVETFSLAFPVLSVGDTVTVSEDITTFFPKLLMSVSDSITLSELVAFPKVFIDISDLIGVSENLNIFIPILFSDVIDSLTVSENINVFLPKIFIDINESVSVSEHLNLYIQLEGDIFETITISENIDLVIPILYINQYDSVAVSENLKIIIPRTLDEVNEVITISENLNILLPEIFIDVNDSTILSEHLILNIQLEEDVVETITISENIDLVIPILHVDQYDSIAISESVNLLIPKAFIEVTDSVTVSENINIVSRVFISISDSVVVSEIMEENTSVEFNVNESITVSDIIHHIGKVYKYDLNRYTEGGGYADIYMNNMEYSGDI